MKNTVGRPVKYAHMFDKLDDFKLDFLKQIKKETSTENSYKDYEGYMCKVRKYELTNSKTQDLSAKSKDELESIYKNDTINLYNFTTEEIETMLLRFKISSINSLNSHIAVINRYRLYAMAMKKIPLTTNVIYEPNDEQKIMLLYLRGFKDQLISKEALYSLCDTKIKNEQDKALFSFIFWCGKGKGFANIVNLKISDIDKENRIIHLKDRDVQVDEKLINYLINAHHQERYEKCNGNNTSNADFISLNKNKYIFRGAVNRRSTDDKVKIQVLTNRVNKLNEFLGVFNVSMNSIEKSGMIYFLKEDMKKTNRKDLNEYTYNEIRNILKQFGKKTDSVIISLKRFYKGIEKRANMYKLTSALKGDEQTDEKIEIDKIIELDNILSTSIGVTEKNSIIKTRIGQGLFKKKLEKIECKCKICGLKNKDLLIASHIKPWKDCNSKERLDYNNGFLLCPIHDALFDKGYISFEDDGKIIVSQFLEKDCYKLLNISGSEQIKITNKNKIYLKWHRNNIFKR